MHHLVTLFFRSVTCMLFIFDLSSVLTIALFFERGQESSYLYPQVLESSLRLVVFNKRCLKIIQCANNCKEKLKINRYFKACVGSVFSVCLQNAKNT